VTGFRNAIVAGINLIREAIQSPNYEPGVAGWTINKDGTSEFAEATVRGMVVAGTAPDSHIIIDPDVQIAFNTGFLQAVIRMFPEDDPLLMMESMLGVVTFDPGNADQENATVLHSPIVDTGYAIVLESMADDASRDAHASIGPVTADGDAMSYTGIHMFEDYGITSPAHLSYAGTPGQVVEVFQTAGASTWTAPPGVTSVKVECWGGGGRGGPKGAGTLAGAGGGGGEYARRNAVAVTPGNGYSLTVGAGSSTAGVNGATSEFIGDAAVKTTAHGGSTPAGANGGAGGTGSTTGTHFDGGNGGSTVFSGGGGGGGAAGTANVGGLGSPGDSHGFGGTGGTGGAVGGGNGGKGGTLNGVQGLPGNAPGGGGGGQGGGTSVGPGAGAAGQVRLTYTPSVIPIGASMAAAAGTDRFGNSYPAGFEFAGKTVPDSTLFQSVDAVATSTQALTTTRTDVTGMTVTFTTKNPNAIALVSAVWDVTVSAGVAGTGNVSVGEIIADGSLLTPIITGQESNTERGSFAYPALFPVVLPAAGSHTIKGTIRKNGTATAAISAGNGTVIAVLVLDFFG